MFWCALLCVHFSFAIILMGKRERELVALLCLSGCSWLLCGPSSRCHDFVCSLWLWYFLIILAYFFGTLIAPLRVTFTSKGSTTQTAILKGGGGGGSCTSAFNCVPTPFEPWHGISNNVVCATSKASDQPAHTYSLIRAFASRLNILWVISYWLNTIWNF